MSDIFAPTISAKFAISFIKLIFVARKALAAYLIISDDFKSVKTSGLSVLTNDL